MELIDRLCPSDEARSKMRQYMREAYIDLNPVLEEAAATITRLTAERDLLKNWQDHHATEVPRLQMRLDAMTAELAEAREKLGLAYETAATVCDDESARRRKQAAELAATGNATEQNVIQHARWSAGALALELAAADIRALDPDATAALAARDKRVREEVLDAANAYLSVQYGLMALGSPIDRERILARLDQPKAESGK